MRKLIGLLVLVCWAGSAGAATIKYNIVSSVGGSSGNGITGSFSYDADLEVYTDVDITSVQGSGIPGVLISGTIDNLTGDASYASSTRGMNLEISLDGVANNGYPFCTPSDGLMKPCLVSEAYAPVPTDPTDPTEFFWCVSWGYCGLDGAFVYGTASAVSPVPLPAAAWLFISAIAGLAGAKRLSRPKGSA